MGHAGGDNFSVFGIATGFAAERRGDYGGEIDRLFPGEAAGGDLEVTAGSGFRSEDTGAPFDDVEIEFQNSLLGEDQFHDGDEGGFDTFANPGGTGGEEEILHQLLGDGGGSAAASGLFALVDGVFNFHPIEAVVLVEAGVFGGDEGVLQGRGDLGHRDEDVFLVIRGWLRKSLDAALDLDGGGDG